MSTYSSPYTKAENAVAYALSEFADSAGLTGYTTCKGGDNGEIGLTAIVIACESVAPVAPDAKFCTYGTKEHRIAIKAITHSDVSRETHDALVGGLFAAFVTSADQMVTVLNAAGVTGFTAQNWAFVDAPANYEEQRRETVLNFNLTAST